MLKNIFCCCFQNHPNQDDEENNRNKKHEHDEFLLTTTATPSCTASTTTTKAGDDIISQTSVMSNRQKDDHSLLFGESPQRSSSSPTGNNKKNNTYRDDEEITHYAESLYTRDPKTQLPFIDISSSSSSSAEINSKIFSNQLKDCTIFFFSVVEKYNRAWKPQKRVLYISDSHLYLCYLNGEVARTVSIVEDIRQIIGVKKNSAADDAPNSGSNDDDTLLILKMVDDNHELAIPPKISIEERQSNNNEGQHDMVLNFARSSDREYCVKVLQLLSTVLHKEKNEKEDEEEQIARKKIAATKGGVAYVDPDFEYEVQKKRRRRMTGLVATTVCSEYDDESLMNSVELNRAKNWKDKNVPVTKKQEFFEKLRAEELQQRLL